VQPAMNGLDSGGGEVEGGSGSAGSGNAALG
jgi:hypothetical protein